MATPPPLTSSAAVSPARTSRMPASASASTASDPASGRSSLGSFASFDRASSSWRTSQLSLFGGSIGFSEIWPRSGSMRNGTCFERPTSARPISERESSFLPTPSATPYGSNQGGSAGRVGPTRLSLDSMAAQGLWLTPTAADSRRSSGTYARGSLTLSGAVRTWPTPTPTAGDSRASGGRNTTAAKPGSRTHAGTSLTDAVVRQSWPTPTARNGDPKRGMPSAELAQRRLDDGKRNLEDAIAVSGAGATGALNPRWVEWLMGFPDEWTACAASETPSSGSKRRSRSKS